MNKQNNNSDCSTCSSSDDIESDDELDQIVNSRKKRGIDWCATSTESVLETPGTSTNRSRVVVWPPLSNSTASNVNRHVSSQQRILSNTDYGSKVQLYSKTGYLLAINADGTVNGTRDSNDLHTKLQLLNIGEIGGVRIVGLLTGRFLAFDNRGRLHAHYDYGAANTQWLEIPVDSHKCYQSMLSVAEGRKRGKGWYLGIKKSGKGKNGKKTKVGQNATMFLSKR